MVLAHRGDGFRLEHLIAVAAALVENHLSELDVVTCGAVQAAAAHMEFRFLLELEWNRAERPVRPACMHAK